MDNTNEVYKQIKHNIELLINDQKLNDANILIDEYLKMVKDDGEIYSIKAVIAIMEGQLDEAEKIIKNGLEIDNNNFDLLYNLGYIYEGMKRNAEAKAAYITAGKVCNNDFLKKQIKEKVRVFDNKNYIYKVILCGSAELCKKFQLEMKEWDIIGYVDEENKNQDKIYPIISIEKIKNYNYDFIIIINEHNEDAIIRKLQKNYAKNIYLYSGFKVHVIEGFDYKIKELLSKKNIELIITGLSYAEVGIKPELLCKNSINFALSSQDLFYDYKIVRYLLNYREIKNSIRYLIMGLSYYSFDYDLTKSIAKYRIHRYIDYIEDVHNNNDKIGIDITKCFYDKRSSMEDYCKMNNMKANSTLEINNYEQEYVSKKNSCMDYNLTREENILIFEEYLKMLKDYNIEPIIVICPTSKYYYSCYQNGFQRNKFYKIIEEFKKSYNFQIADYFNSDLFEDNDFWDYGHLNGKGAEKFTGILNSKINW